VDDVNALASEIARRLEELMLEQTRRMSRDAEPS